LIVLIKNQVQIPIFRYRLNFVRTIDRVKVNGTGIGLLNFGVVKKNKSDRPLVGSRIETSGILLESKNIKYRAIASVAFEFRVIERKG
jgi:hypothetical protein